MREADVKKLYAGITNVRDEFVEEAQTGKLYRGQTGKPNRRSDTWLKRCVTVLVPALCLGLTLATGKWLWSDGTDENGGQDYGGGCSWGRRDSTLLEVRREGFTPEFPEEAKAAFEEIPGVVKVYKILDNLWFLAENMTDFSQVLTDETIYVFPGSVRGIDGPKEDGAYAVYTLDENGMPRWGMGASASEDDMIPSQFNGLTHDIIEEDLAGIDYEDYIVAQSTQLYTVFVWARCGEGKDMFVTYPARPEFLGLENRGRYTLEELRYILAEAFRDSEDE